VHREVAGLPADAIDDDRLLDALTRQLPDASLSTGTNAPLAITLSQFSLTDRAAAQHQTRRVSQALVAVGAPHATVRIDDLIREDIWDDLRVVAHAVRWRARRALDSATAAIAT
jgi:hypothetical protein